MLMQKALQLYSSSNSLFLRNRNCTVFKRNNRKIEEKSMIFRKIKSVGLAHYSYFIADKKEALVIDPRRDCDIYLKLANEGGFRITKILETHRNEDYVAGSSALSFATGADVYHGKNLNWGYGTSVGDGDIFKIGNLQIKVLETPGHTPESLTYTLADTNSSYSPIFAFTGDSLFSGDTGRVDLFGKSKEEIAAEMLYNSLFKKILPLGDHVILCPSHGRGSICGSSIADLSQSTLGYERLFNPKLQEMDKKAFIELKLIEKHVKPPYFKRMEEWNQYGSAPVFERLPMPTPFGPEEFFERISQGAIIADLRSPQAFAGGHIPGSYNIWQDGISTYFGWIMPMDREIVLVVNERRHLEEITRQLLRIGYDNISGYLRDGFESWQNAGLEIDRLGTIDTQTLFGKIERGENIQILDVRKPSEWEDGIIEGSQLIFVGEMENHLHNIPEDKQIITMCSVGNRGSIGASILAKHDFPHVYNYLGGFEAWKNRQKNHKIAS